MHSALCLMHDTIMTDSVQSHVEGKRIVLSRFPHEGQHEDFDSDCADMRHLSFFVFTFLWSLTMMQ